jgi:hypothetical protein
MSAAASLPRDIDIPALPGLGTTWDDRGGKYWARRAGMAFMWAVVLLLIVLTDVGIFRSIRHSSRAGFTVALAVDAALAAAVLVYFAIRTARRWNTPTLPGRARTAFRAGRGRTGAVLSGFVQIGYLLAVLAAAALFLFCPAFIIALFLMSLLPETLPERQARLWMAGQLRGPGAPAR